MHNDGTGGSTASWYAPYETYSSTILIWDSINKNMHTYTQFKDDVIDVPNLAERKLLDENFQAVEQACSD